MLKIVKLGRKRYEVSVADDGSVIRIAYVNAVLGKRALMLDGKVARDVIKHLKEAK